MKLMSFARSRAFWLLDFIKGSPVRRAYNNIKKIDEMDSDNPYIAEYQRKAWEILKENACTKTKAYHPYAQLDFSLFPIITKQDIRAAQDDYISSDFVKDELIKMSTSGSTGTPFVCYQNIGKKKQVHAEVIYYSEKVGYRVGDNLSYIRTVVKQNRKSFFKQFIQNQTLIDCRQLSDDGVKLILNAIKNQSKKGNVTLLAYGSTYSALKDYFIAKGIAEIAGAKVCGVISGSDMLFDETRAVVSKVFGNIPMVSRYSNEENGVLAQDEGINNVFVINDADYIVEIVDDNGVAVEDGTIGRIVATDLYNYAMPMIRYDTGDMGAIQTFEINGKKKRCICNFSGRRVDVIYDSYGKVLSPHTVTNAMWDFPDIIQFQMIQKGEGEYTLKLNVDENFNREGELVEALVGLLGSHAKVKIEKVDEIPVLASGKRRYIVNEWKKV